MATTVGDIILSEGLIVSQSDDIAAGTTVDSLVIEFDQAKYEKFLSSETTSPAAACKYRKVSRESRAQGGGETNSVHPNQA